MEYGKLYGKMVSMEGARKGHYIRLRSDALGEFVKFIRRMRSDPELNCPDYCQILLLDEAGEWSSVYGDFVQACRELGIIVKPRPSKSDHRLNH